MPAYTGAEMLRIERMWKLGWKVADIAYALGRNTTDIHNVTARDRKRFPRRTKIVSTAHAPILRAPPKRANAYHHRCDNGAIVNLPVVAGYTPAAEIA